MTLLMLRAALLAQGGGEAGPPVDVDSPWELDTTRHPAGYTLSENTLTAVNTGGGSDYRSWVPTARAIRPWDGRRYWEVLCAPGGASSFNGYMGVISAAQRDAFDDGNNPITLGSIGWRGNGTLWSSEIGSAAQQLAGLPGYGAGDVLMFVLDPGHASLWIGLNGIWHDDPASGAPTWTTAPSTAFYPQIQGRDPGDGGTLRSVQAQFSYPLPPGVQPLGHEDPDLRIHEAHLWIDLGGGARLSTGQAALFLDLGGGAALTTATTALYIEVELP